MNLIFVGKVSFKKIFSKNSFIIFLILDLYGIAHGIQWLTLGKESVSWQSKNRMIQCSLAQKNYGFVRQQVKICRTTFEAMPFVIKAAKETVNVCQQLFEKRRWNCSTILTAPNYTPDLTTGTREQAFVYALSSAAVAYATSKACASGNLFNCSCSNHPKIPPNKNFKWGGCGDNIQWGLNFSKRFTDSLEKAKQNKKNGGKSKRGSKSHTTFEPSSGMAFTNESTQINDKLHLVAAVNLQNNRVGRKVIEINLKIQCKCHGVSGSCSIKICWKALPKFYEIGEQLQKKYRTSYEVSSKKFYSAKTLTSISFSLTPYGGDDLIYTNKSPDYCLKDEKTGSLGTRGRICNRTSQDFDSCEIMCCGRGHITLSTQKVEKCKCKFHWCCNVTCKKCLQWVDTHICN